MILPLPNLLQHLMSILQPAEIFLLLEALLTMPIYLGQRCFKPTRSMVRKGCAASQVCFSKLAPAQHSSIHSGKPHHLPMLTYRGVYPGMHGQIKILCFRIQGQAISD